MSKYPLPNELRGNVKRQKAKGEAELSWRLFQAEGSAQTLTVTMAAYLMYIVLHVSVCGLSGVGVVLFQTGCMADATFDCRLMLNVIAKLAPGLNMTQHRNVTHWRTLIYFAHRFHYMHCKDLDLFKSCVGSSR